MLTHQPSEDGPSPAAQARVTKDELAKAIATIEARRQEEAHRLTNTLQIGQAISELNLDISPDELLAEVEALRGSSIPLPAPPLPSIPPSLTNRQKHDIATMNRLTFLEAVNPFRSKEANRSRKAHGRASGVQYDSNSLTIFAGVIGTLLLIGVISGVIYCRTPDPTESETPSRPAIASGPSTHFSVTPDTAFYQKLALCSGPAPDYRIVSTPLTYSTSVQTGEEVVQPDEPIYPRRAVPDGYSVWENPTMALKTDATENETGGVVVRPTNLPVSFPGSAYFDETRYDGRDYCRCWIARSNIPNMRRGGMVPVWPTSRQGLVAHEVRVPVTIPKACFVAATTGHENVRGVPENRHTWENFPSLTVPKYTVPKWALQPMVFIAPDDLLTVQDDVQDPVPGRALFDASSKIMQYKDIREGQVIHCSSYTLAQFMGLIDRPIPQENVFVDVRPSLFDTFTLVKHDGNPYLRAWIAARPSRKEIGSGTLMLHSRPDAPDFTVPPVAVTLRLDHFTFEGALTSEGETSFPLMSSRDDPFMRLNVSHVQFDRHAWEHH